MLLGTAASRTSHLPDVMRLADALRTLRLFRHMTPFGNQTRIRILRIPGLVAAVSLTRCPKMAGKKTPRIPTIQDSLPMI